MFVRFPVTAAGAARCARATRCSSGRRRRGRSSSNAAVAVDPELTYVRTAGGEVLAEALVGARARRGRRDRRPLPGRRDARRALRAAVPVHPGRGVRRPKGHTVLPATSSAPTTAPGIVHTAIAFGEDDYRLGAEQGLAVVNPVAARRHLRRAHRPVRRPLGQGRRRRPDRGPARARPAAARRDAPARLPALLALRHAAALLRQAVLVHPHVGDARPAARRQRDRRRGTRRTSSTAASASGWRTTSTGRSRASATGARRCPSGAARTATPRRSARSPRSRSARAASCPTRTGRTSTSTRGRARSAAPRCAACPR